MYNKWQIVKCWIFSSHRNRSPNGTTGMLSAALYMKRINVNKVWLDDTLLPIGYIYMSKCCCQVVPLIDLKHGFNWLHSQRLHSLMAVIAYGPHETQYSPLRIWMKSKQYSRLVLVSRMRAKAFNALQSIQTLGTHSYRNLCWYIETNGIKSLMIIPFDGYRIMSS